MADDFASTTSTTTAEVPRIVGDPLPVGVFWAAGVVALLLILAAGLLARRRMSAPPG